MRTLNPGQSLPPSLRHRLEDAFQVDLSTVRLQLDDSPLRVGALAMTRGETITLVPECYQPETLEGMELLGHEVAHVLQQRQRERGAPVSGLLVAPALEAEADLAGARVARGLGAAWLGKGADAPSSGRVLQPKLVIYSSNFIAVARMKLALLSITGDGFLTFGPEQSKVTEVQLAARIRPDPRKYGRALVSRIIQSDRMARITHATGTQSTQSLPDCIPDHQHPDKSKYFWSFHSFLKTEIAPDKSAFGTDNAKLLAAASDGTGCDVTAWWNTDDIATTDEDADGWPSRQELPKQYRWIALAHELIHADRIQRGVVIWDRINCKTKKKHGLPWDIVQENGKTHAKRDEYLGLSGIADEMFVVGFKPGAQSNLAGVTFDGTEITENMIREENHFRLRGQYP
ncbi:eCIS core domain-containing protein [Corallococcus llansteffanensis]|nr:DUF4157 domain-containing protein [Corallococcus llansteffanensis]